MMWFYDKTKQNRKTSLKYPHISAQYKLQTLLYTLYGFQVCRTDG